MAEILYGKPVAQAIQEDIRLRAAALAEDGHVPTLAILRVGERGDDLAYERRVLKLCGDLGIEHSVTALPEDVSQEDFTRALAALNETPAVDGILLFRPLPAHLDEEAACQEIDLGKDIDRMHPDNLKLLFSDLDGRYAPCTPEAVVEMLKFYQVPLDGANVVIVNRSLVLGRPLSMLFLKENATVTVCHSHTRDLPAAASRADILVTGIGRAGFFGAEYAGAHTTVVDVGINFQDGRMTGDLRFDDVSQAARAVTPVPGGVGAVTSSILLRHLIESAEGRQA